MILSCFLFIITKRIVINMFKTTFQPIRNKNGWNSSKINVRIVDFIIILKHGYSPIMISHNINESNI